MRALAVALGASVAVAGPAGAGAGTSGFQFLRLGSGARGEGLGGAATALVDGADALAWNPARLAAGSRGEVAISYFNWLQDAGAGQAGIVLPVGRGAAGLAARSLSVSEFTNVAGEPPVGQSDLAIGVGGAYPLLGSLRVGAGLQLVRSELAGARATGWAGSLGLDYRWVEGWNAVVALRDAGPAFGYGGADERLPTQVSLGLGSTFGELRVDSEVLWEEGPGWGGVLGAEYRLAGRLALRAGARLGGPAGGAVEPWAAGLGLSVRPGLEVEYAFRDGAFEASHRVGVRWALGRSPGAGERPLARSPREFYVDVLSRALESSLVSFPADVRDTIVVRAAAPDEAAAVISRVVAERLREHGLAARTAEPPPEVPEDLDPETEQRLRERGIGVPPDHPLLEYEIHASEYEIVRSRRERWVGPRTVERRAAVDLELRLIPPGGGEPRWEGRASADDRETVAAASVPSSNGYPRATAAEGRERKLHPLVEPAIVGGIVTGLAVIFFSTRNVGE